MSVEQTNQVIDEDIKNIVKFDLPWDRFEGQSILVTGANGFLPAYMIKTLMHLNDENNLRINIIGLVRNELKAFSQFKNHKNRKDLKFIKRDICDPLSINDDINYIIHAASQASPKYYGKDPVGTLCANTIGTYNLLNLARSKNIESFLFFSSGEIYGQVADPSKPINELYYGYLDPLDVRSCYAESKRIGETMCVSWSHQYGIPIKIVRPFHTYGPGMDLNDGRVFADFVANIVNGSNILLNSDGSAIRSFCYLTDATQGFFTVILKGLNGHAYNVGNSEAEISILDLAKLLVKLYPEKQLEIEFEMNKYDEGYIKSRTSRYCPDISKIEKLGWRPTTCLEEGFRRTIASYCRTSAKMDDCLLNIDYLD